MPFSALKRWTICSGTPSSRVAGKGFVIENIIRVLPGRASWGFYRTSGGAEVDLVVESGSGELWVFEIKRSSAPKVSKGFHSACEDLKPDRRLVVRGGVGDPDDHPMVAASGHDLADHGLVDP